MRGRIVGAEAQKSPMLTSRDVHVVTSEASPYLLVSRWRGWEVGGALHDASLLSFSLTMRSRRM